MKERDRMERNGVLEKVGAPFMSVNVENDYLDRERRENALEAGFTVDPMPEFVGSDIERIIRRSDRLMTNLENERAGGSMMRERRERSWPEPNEFVPDVPAQKRIIRIEL